jgi:hypothetical protein
MYCIKILTLKNLSSSSSLAEGRCLWSFCRQRATRLRMFWQHTHNSRQPRQKRKSKAVTHRAEKPLKLWKQLKVLNSGNLLNSGNNFLTVCSLMTATAATAAERDQRIRAAAAQLVTQLACIQLQPGMRIATAATTNSANQAEQLEQQHTLEKCLRPCLSSSWGGGFCSSMAAARHCEQDCSNYPAYHGSACCKSDCPSTPRSPPNTSAAACCAVCMWIPPRCCCCFSVK